MYVRKAWKLLLVGVNGDPEFYPYIGMPEFLDQNRSRVTGTRDGKGIITTIL